jgi:hypothetical protein
MRVSATGEEEAGGDRWAEGSGVEDGPYMNGEEELCGVSNFGTRGNLALWISLSSAGLNNRRSDSYGCGERARDLSLDTATTSKMRP